MRTGTPLVSIIVRTKDRPELLKRALRSIRVQTYSPIEIVLVNDGGCDLDIAEVKSILGDILLEYVRLVKNMGRAAAANEGVAKATGEFIGFLDDDDIYYPNAVRTLADGAINLGNQVVYGKVHCRTYNDSRTDNGRLEFTFGEPFNRDRLIFENFIPFNSLLVPRSFFHAIGTFDSGLEIYEDWDYLIRLSAAHDFHFLDTFVAEYSIFGTATITGKGGIPLQTFHREKILQKHLHTVQACDIVQYVQRMVDKVVLEKEKELGELHFHVRERDEEIGRLREGNDWLKGSLTSKDEEFKAKDKEIQSLNRELRKLNQELQKLREGIDWLKGIVSSKDEEIENSRTREIEVRKVLDDILSSTIWKATKPLRNCGTLVRKFFG